MRDESTRPFIPHPLSLIPLLVIACAQRPQSTHEIHRVVSLAPNVTEIVYAIGGGAKLVGADDFSDFPEAATRLPKVGGVEPNVEKIAALRPDLVIANASNVHPNLQRALAAVRIPLMVVRTERLTDVSAAMAQIGAREPGDPRRAIAAFDRQIEHQRRQRARRPRVLFVVWTNPLYVAGRQTFVDDLFELTGATNASEVNGWPQYSLESFIAHRPDVLLYPNRSVTPAAIRELLQRTHVNVQAVAVDENIFTRAGPRLADAAASLNHILDAWEHSR
jgi:iron complex transport system substrate-binding protein